MILMNSIIPDSSRSVDMTSLSNTDLLSDGLCDDSGTSSLLDTSPLKFMNSSEYLIMLSTLKSVTAMFTFVLL